MRAALALALVLGACSAARPAVTGRPARHRTVAENVLRRDYAGSAECEGCHRDVYEKWLASPMRNMTRRIADATVRAPFAGETFDFKGERVTLTTEGGTHMMRLGDHAYRVTKVIGGRTREDFVGRDAGEELVLPLSWVYATGTWRYKGYSVMLPERPRLSVGPVWRQTCIFCHNTAPYLTQIYDDLLGPGTRGYQGAVSDALVPRDRLWRVVPSDERALGEAVADEVAALGGARPDATAPLRKLLDGAMRATRRHFGEAQLVEVGIGCEACHLGSRAHADDPEVRPTLEPRGALFRVVTPDGEAPTHAELVNHTCVRCHTVLFSEYDWTWEGGHRDATAGGSSINSGEARDLLLGACRRQLACTACHDPHTEDSRAKLDALATPAGDATCARCHAALASDGHSHHRGVGCVACHMPRKNMGLAYQLTRYHRIGSADDPARVLADRPLECALCHPTDSVAKIVGTMEAWWGKRYDRAALRRLYGDDLDVGALAATLARGLPHEQAAAAGALGDARVRAAAPLIVPLLAHAYPLVRHFARRALEQIEGRPLAVDLDGAADDILAAARRWLTPP